MSETKTICKHCDTYFNTRGRLCTAASYLECDCPKCQGLCSCLPTTEVLLATTQHEYQRFCGAADVYARRVHAAEVPESAAVERALKVLLEQGKRFGAAFNACMKSQESK